MGTEACRTPEAPRRCEAEDQAFFLERSIFFFSPSLAHSMKTGCTGIHRLPSICDAREGFSGPSSQYALSTTSLKAYYSRGGNQYRNLCTYVCIVPAGVDPTEPTADDVGTGLEPAPASFGYVVVARLCAFSNHAETTTIKPHLYRFCLHPP